MTAANNLCTSKTQFTAINAFKNSMWQRALKFQVIHHTTYFKPSTHRKYILTYADFYLLLFPQKCRLYRMASCREPSTRARSSPRLRLRPHNWSTWPTFKKVVKDLKTKLFLSVKRFDIRDTSNHTPNTISIREGPGGEGYHFTPHYLCLTADVSHDV